MTREKVGVQETDLAPSTPLVARRGRPDARGLAREGLVELGYSPVEADELLREAAGDSAEELLAQALRTARAEA